MLRKRSAPTLWMAFEGTRASLWSPIGLSTLEQSKVCVIVGYSLNKFPVKPETLASGPKVGLRPPPVPHMELSVCQMAGSRGSRGNCHRSTMATEMRQIYVTSIVVGAYRSIYSSNVAEFVGLKMRHLVMHLKTMKQCLLAMKTAKG